MTIDDHTIVSLSYEVRDGSPEGPLLEQVEVNHPFKFMFGVGKMLPAWERRLFGLKVGTGFAFKLSPEDAYGVPSKKHILTMPLQQFQDKKGQIKPDLLVVGQFITLTNADGKAVHAKILKWDNDVVTLDANHALAGKTLFFSGAVLEVRQPSVDELIQKQVL